MSYRKFALAVLASACLSFGTIAPTRADSVIVEGTIAPYLWNGSSYYVAPLIDPGIFAPAGTSLTGDAIHIVWNDDPAVTAAITIDGTTVTLGPATNFFTPYAQISPTYQNITVQLAPNLAVNSYDPFFAAHNNPFGLGGSLELCFPVDCQYPATPMEGYFYVTSMTDLAQVPAPIVGEGPFGLLAGALLLVGFLRKYRVSLVYAATHCRLDCRRAFRHDDIRPRLNQLGGDPRKCVLFSVGKTVLEADVLPLDPAIFLQPLTKRL
jgi:hypothetical protein